MNGRVEPRIQRGRLLTLSVKKRKTKFTLGAEPRGANMHARSPMRRVEGERSVDIPVEAFPFPVSHVNVAGSTHRDERVFHLLPRSLRYFVNGYANEIAIAIKPRTYSSSLTSLRHAVPARRRGSG